MRLGQDIEKLLVNANGKHISVIGLINADKWHPMQVPGMPEGFTLQEDNVAIEFGMPPASSEDMWNEYVALSLESAKPYIQGLSFSNLSATVYDADQMEHPNAHVFGCEPDYNAWTKDYNPSPCPPHPFMRSAGGHIHVETKENPYDVIRAMDLFLGVPSVLMDNGELRKQLYGKAGAHRIKSYGVEYRTLSPFWSDTEPLRRWVWRNTERALANLGKADEYAEAIQRSINSNDKDMAAQLVATLGLEVV